MFMFMFMFMGSTEVIKANKIQIPARRAHSLVTVNYVLLQNSTTKVGIVHNELIRKGTSEMALKSGKELF